MMKPKLITVLWDIEIIYSINAMIWTIRFLPYHYEMFIYEYFNIALYFSVSYFPLALITMAILRLLKVRSREKIVVISAMGGCFLTLQNILLFLSVFAPPDWLVSLEAYGEMWLYMLISCGLYIMLMRRWNAKTAKKKWELQAK